jgi:hypothetical protein
MPSQVGGGHPLSADRQSPETQSPDLEGRSTEGLRIGRLSGPPSPDSERRRLMSGTWRYVHFRVDSGRTRPPKPGPRAAHRAGHRPLPGEWLQAGHRARILHGGARHHRRRHSLRAVKDAAQARSPTSSRPRAIAGRRPPGLRRGETTGRTCRRTRWGSPARRHATRRDPPPRRRGPGAVGGEVGGALDVEAPTVRSSSRQLRHLEQREGALLHVEEVVAA